MLFSNKIISKYAAFNDFYGDYGATITLLHQLDGVKFHTLYGHLSLRDIQGLQEGEFIKRGTEFAHFGEPKENGHWPPHLHFQVIEDMGEMKGDYRGVCKFSERGKYLTNSPNPDTILRMMQYTSSEGDCVAACSSLDAIVTVQLQTGEGVRRSAIGIRTENPSTLMPRTSER